MRGKIAIVILMTLMAAAITPVYAATIRIDPHSTGYPRAVMLSSPADFYIYDVSKTDYEPHILLVMTKASYNGLTGDVTVTWTGGSTTFKKADFKFAWFGGGNKIPPGVKACYTVASCADHLGAPWHGVYYAYGPFLSGPIGSTKQSFTVTATSDSLRMLVYAIGSKGSASGKFDNNVPHTQPGFVVPEPATIMVALASFAAIAVYAGKRKKLF